MLPDDCKLSHLLHLPAFSQLNYLSKAYGLWLKTGYKLEITIFMIFPEKLSKWSDHHVLLLAVLKLIKFHELASFRTKVISRRTFETSGSFFSNLQNGDLPGSCTDGFKCQCNSSSKPMSGYRLGTSDLLWSCPYSGQNYFRFISSVKVSVTEMKTWKLNALQKPQILM